MLLVDEKLEPLGNGVNVIVSKEHMFWTDTIILANFADPKKNDVTADLGAGCGTIPLIWCRDNKTSHITAIEIQKNACDMMSRSVKLNNLENKIDVINANICNLDGLVKKASFDLVVCNPPYKPIGTGIVNPISSLKIARHEQECTLKDITSAAASMLNFGGRFCLCLRPERICDVFEAMRASSIEPKRLRFVQQRKSKAPKLFLVEGKRGARPGLITMPTLFIEDENGGCSEEMKKIYGFYGENKK